jgi:CRP/FNR family cyclic AMP-dependent transcriptional regulator
LDGNKTAVDFITSQGELIEVAAGQSVITQGGEDNDLYFIVSGSFDIIVNGRHVAIRGANNSVGEMSAIQPTQTPVSDCNRQRNLRRV